MTSTEFGQSLLRLQLSPAEVAQLLTVSSRTVRRWLDGEELPGPAEQAIRAWLRLHERHLPWRPDSIAIEFDDRDQIAAHRKHGIGLERILTRVDARGGAKLLWNVDWDRGQARMGPLLVSFYKLVSGSFSIASYSRTDRPADFERDREMIEDAIWCISHALKKKNPDFGPVTLVVHDGPCKNRVARQRMQVFDKAKDAIAYTGQHRGEMQFHDPFIMTECPSEILWDIETLKRECVKRRFAPKALQRLATYLKTHCEIFVQNGAKSLGYDGRADRMERIKLLADELLILGSKAEDGLVEYEHFDQMLGRMHSLGVFPPNELVSNVARALEGMPFAIEKDD